jgi:hypothetical protein
MSLEAMSSTNKYTDRLSTPQSDVEALARAVPTDVVRDIVRDHYHRAASTPPAEPSLVDRLVAKFAKIAVQFDDIDK